MSTWTKIRDTFTKKILPVAATAAGAYFGAPYLGKAVDALGGLFGGGGSPPPSGVVSKTPDASFMGPPEEPAQQVEVTGSKPGFDWKGAIGALAPVASSAIGYLGQEKANAANIAQAEKQMAFQADQSSTAYQRATADMKSAGLSPLLAYSQGGASSGAGSSAVVGNSLAAGANSALSTAQAIETIRNLKATNENIQAQTNYTDSQTALNALVGPKLQSETTQSISSARHLDALRANATAALSGVAADSAVRSGTIGPSIRQAHAEAVLSENEVPRSRNRAEAESTWWMKHVDPYISGVGAAAHSAGSVLRGLRR